MNDAPHAGDEPRCAGTEQDAHAQLARVARLRPRVVELARRPGSVTLELRADATDRTLDEYLGVERECCSFLEIRRTDSAAGSRVVFSGARPEHEAALALIARAFDPAPTAHSSGPSGAPQRRSMALLGAVSLACLACLLPVLLAAGAAGSLAAAFGGEVAVVAAVALGLGAVAVALRRRSRSNDACGC